MFFSICPTFVGLFYFLPFFLSASSYRRRGLDVPILPFQRIGALVKEIYKHMYYMYIGYLNIPMSFKIIYLCGCV